MIEKLPSRYTVLHPLGTGAMGDVYHVRDTRLRRDVAVKVLPAYRAHDKRWLGRFRREARVLAGLNHSHIAALYDLEEVDGTSFLIMEYVPGETLAGPLGRSGFPVAEGLDLFRQLAGAVEAAHERGVVHRDLKPSNVIVTPDGNLKVLDFGLARLRDSLPGEMDLFEPSLLSEERTADGAVIGTVGYMSPEQVRGRPVDRRADIWAFGCMLYEALSGRRTFKGESPADTLAQILEREPDWAALPVETPARIRALLQRCLAKDLSHRLRDIGEAWVAIDETLQGRGEYDLGAGGGTEALGSAERHPARTGAARGLGGLARGQVRAVAPWAAVGLAVASAVLALLVARPWRAAVPALVTRFVVHLSGPMSGCHVDALSISPDGAQLVYSGAQGLHLRRLDQLEITLRHIPQGGNPFFAPDGRWVAFTGEWKLQKLSLVDEGTRTICNVPDLRGASWGDADSILYAPSFSSGLWMVSSQGGTPRPVTRLDAARGEVTHRWPETLPGGEAALFTIRRQNQLSFNEAEIAVVSLRTGERRTILAGGSQPRYSPSGHLLFARDSTLLAVPFDLRQLRVTGSPVPVLRSVVNTPSTGAALYGVSRNGTLVYVPSGAEDAPTSGRLMFFDRQGRRVEEVPNSEHLEDPNFSPQGDCLAVTIVGAQNDIGVYDRGRGTFTRLTFDPGEDAYPIWSPDGKRIVFSSSREGPLQLFWKPTDGSGQEHRLTTGPNNHNPCAWSPDGRTLLYTEDHPETRADIWVLGPDSLAPRPFLQTPHWEAQAGFSPNGRWVAYESDESGQREIWVTSLEGGSNRRQITNGGGSSPRWSRRGELFYMDGQRSLVAARVRTAPTFAVTQVQKLFVLPGSQTLCDVSPDGQSFVTRFRGADPERIVVVLNWPQEIARAFQKLQQPEAATR